jgi:hypothetical protein
MAGRKPKNPDSPPRTGRPLRRLLAVAVALAGAGGLVWGIARLGEEARRGLGERDRYSVRFADIDCDPPPNTDRAAFLAEVRYLSNFPESFQSLSPDLSEKLAAAFATHPWVERTEGVAVEPDRRVRVQLRFRAPALAVRTPDGVRVVDSAGVLLPAEASAQGLPLLASPLPSPNETAGRAWQSDDVRRALELVAAYHPRTLEKSPQGWRLVTPDGKTLAVER